MQEIALPEGFTLPTEFSFSERGYQIPATVEITPDRLVREIDQPGGEGGLLFHGSKLRIAVPDRDTFARFLNLATGTPRQILRFAQSYGPLGMTRVQDAAGEWRLKTIGATFVEVLGGRLYFTELFDLETNVIPSDVQSWRGKARWTVRLLDVASKVRLGTNPSADEWKPIDDLILSDQFRSLYGREVIERVPEELDEREKALRHREEWHIAFTAWRRRTRWRRPNDPWERLTRAVSALIGGNPVGLPMLFRFSNGRLSFSSTSCLRTYLDLQTLHAIGQGSEMVVCAGTHCHRMFVPKRHKPPNQRRWCPKCTKQGEPGNDAVRRWRERERARRETQVTPRVSHGKGCHMGPCDTPMAE